MRVWKHALAHNSQKKRSSHKSSFEETRTCCFLCTLTPRPGPHDLQIFASLSPPLTATFKMQTPGLLWQSSSYVGPTPGQGAKNPHALGLKRQIIKQKQYCNKFNKDFKNGPHQKRKKNLEEKASPDSYLTLGVEWASVWRLISTMILRKGLIYSCFHFI